MAWPIPERDELVLLVESPGLLIDRLDNDGMDSKPLGKLQAACECIQKELFSEPAALCTSIDCQTGDEHSRNRMPRQLLDTLQG